MSKKLWKSYALQRKKHTKINGLKVIKQYLTDEEEEELLSIIKSDDFPLKSLSNSPNSRRVAHYGYNYAYNRSGLSKADPIPDIFNKLIDPKRLAAASSTLSKIKFDQLIINEYTPGQQISWHVDHTKMFGPIIFCITIGASTDISFKLGDQIVKVKPPRKSVYWMSGDSRYKWAHSLTNKSSDTRYSLTFRSIST